MDMKRAWILQAFCLGSLLTLSSMVMAADYSRYSTEELAAMRGTLRNLSAEEREAFRTEWQKRLQQMSPEERATYTRGNGAGMGSGSCSGQGYGQGLGKGYGRGRR